MIFKNFLEKVSKNTFGCMLLQFFCEVKCLSTIMDSLCCSDSSSKILQQICVEFSKSSIIFLWIQYERGIESKESVQRTSRRMLHQFIHAQWAKMDIFIYFLKKGVFFLLANLYTYILDISFNCVATQTQKQNEYRQRIISNYQVRRTYITNLFIMVSY